MDLSALIFVALAVAWAAYLIPKALKHHEEDRRHRPVERFSASMRVLASRDTADGRTTQLVVPGRPAGASSAGEEAVEVEGRESAAAVVPPRPTGAARRRRRVLGTLLALTLVVGVLAAFSVVALPWLAAPVVLLVAWLVACRVMVRSERRPAARVTPRSDRLPVTPQPAVPTPDVDPAADEDGPVTGELVAEAAPAEAEPEPTPEPPAVTVGWDPVPTTLPTYVTKPPATRRSVRTIDLDSTGVWTSGRSESDSQLAREADESARAERADRETAERLAQERRRAGGD